MGILKAMKVIETLADGVLSLEFDQFTFYDEHKEAMLQYLLAFLFDVYNLYHKLNIEIAVLNNLSDKIAKGWFESGNFRVTF